MSTAAQATAARSGALDRLLRPRSVVIVGASATPGALGANLLANLERFAFKGEIYLVNPKRSEINGRPCLPSVDELPEGVDCAVLAIPRPGVLDAVRACARRKIGGVVIFSAGFAEAGAEGLAEQQELARIAEESGMVIEGPNCLGLVNFLEGTPLTFINPPLEKPGEGPCVAVVSQSGAMAAVVAATMLKRKLNVSFSVSTGNEAASSVEDYIEYLLDRPETKVISLIVEQFRKPKKFLELARRARAAGKLIVLIHPGRSSAARESAATHTGAIAGDYAVMENLVRYAGVVQVEMLEELLDVTEIAARCVALPSGGAMVLAESGWLKAQTLDICERFGLPLPTLSEGAAGRLRAALPDFIPPSNPLDTTAQALVDPELYERTMAAVIDEPDFGSFVLPIILTDVATASLKLPPILRALKKLQPKKPVIFAGVDEGAEIPREFVDELRALGVPFFPTPERALKALARLTTALAQPIAPEPAAPAAAPDLPAEGGVIPEYQSKLILKALGVPVPPGRLAKTVEEAQAIAREIGYPVVLKAQSADLSHKSDAGGVVLNLADDAALAEGWTRLYANVAKHRPGLALDGALVETMGKRGLELIVGARNDRDWGPVVLVGFGGVLAEILHDNKVLPAGLPRELILRELNSLKSSALFHGYRGEPALDLDAVADIVMKVGELVRSAPQIREIDVNPVVLWPKGEGAVALDGLIYTD